jgi:hypothetical protein
MRRCRASGLCSMRPDSSPLRSGTPYPPDLNPIEHAFAKPRVLLSAAAKRTVEALWQTLGPALDAFTPAFDAFTPAQCANYPGPRRLCFTSSGKALALQERRERAVQHPRRSPNGRLRSPAGRRGCCPCAPEGERALPVVDQLVTAADRTSRLALLDDRGARRHARQSRATRPRRRLRIPAPEGRRLTWPCRPPSGDQQRCSARLQPAMLVTPTRRAVTACSLLRRCSGFASGATGHSGEDQRDQNDQTIGGIDPERGDLGQS